MIYDIKEIPEHLRHYFKDAPQLGQEATPQEFVATLVRVFAGVHRVLRDDGVLFVNLGDSYAGGKQGRADADRLGGLPAMAKQNAVPIGLKPKDRCLIPERFVIAMQEFGWYVRDVICWCLSPSTRVYARTGRVEGPATLHDLIRLDPATVELWSGEKWVKVLGWSKSECDSPIRLKLRSGEVISATPNHQWPLSDGRLVRTDELKAGDVLASCQLPEPSDPIGSGIDEDAAWFAGLYLAEGHMDDDAIRISGNINELDRHANVSRIVRKFGGTDRLVNNEGDSSTQSIHSDILRGVLSHFIGGKGAKGKHIHPRVWKMSNLILMAFLRGYLAGDGHCDKKNNRWRLGFCGNDLWANDLRTLSARLGFALTLKPCYSQMGKVRTFEAYRGEIRFEKTEHRNGKEKQEVMEICRGVPGTFIDVGVEGEPHLFALASGVLTHNSKPAPMPVSVRDRCTPAWEPIFQFTKSPRYFWDQEAVKVVSGGANGSRFDQGKTARDGVQAGPRLSDDATTANPRNVWQTPLADMSRFELESLIGELVGDDAPDVWRISSEPLKQKHYAAFPSQLPTRCIKAATSERGVCAKCLAPWVRVVERRRVATRPGVESKIYTAHEGVRPGIDPEKNWAKSTLIERANNAYGKAMYPDDHPNQRHSGDICGNRDPQRHCTATSTVDWKPSCECGDETVPATVLDPFSGAGTTCLAAHRLGRHGIGLELNPEYCRLAIERIESDTPEDTEPTPTALFDLAEQGELFAT